jgi:hypothetical protein
MSGTAFPLPERSAHHFPQDCNQSTLIIGGWGIGWHKASVLTLCLGALFWRCEVVFCLAEQKGDSLALRWITHAVEFASLFRGI